MTKSVVVITPTNGNPKLINAINSVKAQTYSNVKHRVIVDGHDFREKTVCGNAECIRDNTGGNGFYGHRIYAGFSHLVNEDIVLFLDQDNSYEPNHVETLVEKIEKNDLLWAYSLRNIYNKDDNFLCRDDCESLGKWPVFNNEKSFHIDTSAYAFRREFLIKVAHLWHQGYAGDRIFFNIIRQNFPEHTYGCSGEYSLNYYLDGNPNSASPDFFLAGNELMRQRYGMLRQGFPWRMK